MLDGCGRKIEYARISVTDRCDLRCVYCMPEGGVARIPPEEILSYEEIVRLVGLLARLGVKKVRLTGGEPLVRRDLASLIEGIRAIDGIEKICLTTNGTLLSQQLPGLAAAGLDSVNISLDAIDEDVFRKITGRAGVRRVLDAIDGALESGLPVKINCVPTRLNKSQIVPMAERFLKDGRLSLRFIELMPIGPGKNIERLAPETVRALLTERFGRMTPLAGEALSGPCRYFKLEGLEGRAGFISAVSDCFCDSCNRVRLTSTGFLKTCLQFERGVRLKPLLEGSDGEILLAMEAAVLAKPERHLFSGTPEEGFEKRAMSQIGG